MHNTAASCCECLHLHLEGPKQTVTFCVMFILDVMHHRFQLDIFLFVSMDASLLYVFQETSRDIQDMIRRTPLYLCNSKSYHTGMSVCASLCTTFPWLDGVYHVSMILPLCIHHVVGHLIVGWARTAVFVM